METLERVIAEHPFFSGLDQEYIKLFVGCASNVRFDEGAYAFREGEEANRFYLIRRGRVALEIFTPKSEPIVVQTLEAGEVLGWSWLVPPYRWRFHARALETTLAIGLDGHCLRIKCDENHDLGYELMKRVASVIQQRLEATLLQVLDVYAVDR
jgi:CRP/FNR family transcriptional regulator, cyclic AMP receptor protein